MSPRVRTDPSGVPIIGGTRAPLSGSNVRRLIARRMIVEATPHGYSATSTMQLLVDRERTDGASFRAAMRRASAWVRGAIRAIATAPDPNPLRGASDEEIAGELLRQIEVKDAQARRRAS